MYTGCLYLAECFFFFAIFILLRNNVALGMHEIIWNDRG